MVDENGKRIPARCPMRRSRRIPSGMQGGDAGFYRTPEFCSACHKANLPNTLNAYKFIRAFTAYDEWQNSKFSSGLR